MKKIYSHKEPNRLLHIIFQKKDFEDLTKEFRTDIIDIEEYLQVACLHLSQDQTFKPHKHIPIYRNTHITQECWIIIQGKVRATYYDFIGHDIIDEVVLEQGDITITLMGGHNYEALEDHTLCYEIKNGPYFGNQADKCPL